MNWRDKTSYFASALLLFDRNRRSMLFSVFCMTSLTVVACQTNITGRFGSETRLIEDLLHGYHNQARPVFDPMDTVNVSFFFSLIQMEDLDEKNQVLRFFGWLSIFWRDEYLLWDPDEYGGLKTVILDSRQIWTPDLTVRNSADDVYSDLTSSKFKSIVSCNGSVELYTAGKVSVNCPLELTKFPFDVQTCYVTLDSWVHNGWQVTLQTLDPKVDMVNYIVNGQWDVTNGFVKVTTIYYDDDIPFYAAEIELRLRRKPLFYMMNVMLPCVILSCLVLMVFYLPVNSGEKVSLGITVLLSFSVFQLLVADVMPKTSDNTPAISVYLVTVMGLAALSICCTLIVLSIHHNDSRRRPPLWQRRLIFGILSKLVLMPRGTSQDDTDSPDAEHLQLNGGYDGAPRSMAPLSSLTLFRPKSMFGKEKKGPDPNFIKCRPPVRADQANVLKEATVDAKTSLLYGIQQDVSMMTTKLKMDNKIAMVKEEWIAMAKVLDRFFLLLFLLATFLVGVVLLGVLPNA